MRTLEGLFGEGSIKPKLAELSGVGTIRTWWTRFWAISPCDFLSLRRLVLSFAPLTAPKQSESWRLSRDSTHQKQPPAITRVCFAVAGLASRTGSGKVASAANQGSAASKR